MIGRVPLFVGAGIFEPVVRRWKCQLNENAKAWAEYEPMPETNHNTVAAIGFPADHNVPLSAIIITSPTEDHPRVRLRNELMYTMCLQNGIMADTFQPQGATALAQLLHAVQFGDYLSYYTAIGYGVDPTAIAPIVELKSSSLVRTSYGGLPLCHPNVPSTSACSSLARSRSALKFWTPSPNG